MRAATPPPSFTEFGPNPFEPDDAAPRLVRVDGGTADELRRQVRAQCGREPGVYGMLDEAGRLIYVGKSRRLRSRLLSYFTPANAHQKSGRIIRDARAIVWEPAGSEFAALLRELQLIRTHQPRWNVQGQPDRDRPAWVCVGRGPARYAYLSRQPAGNVAARFGPFRGGGRVRTAVLAINTYFGLRDCPESQPLAFADQLQLFPHERRAGCLRYEIGTCLGPCAAACTREAYDERVAAALRFLHGADDAPLRDMEQRMRTAAAGQRFERAARLRNEWESLVWLRGRLDYLSTARREFTFVYPVAETGGRAIWYCIQQGHVTAVVRPATNRRTAARLRRILERQIHRPGASPVDADERYQWMMLVLAWFRKRPEELQRTLPMDEALRQCAATPTRPRKAR